MNVVHSINQIPKMTPPIALSIGCFDAIHRGHQDIINTLCELTQQSGSRVILTFSNHPSSLFHPQHPTPQIATLSERLQLFKTLSIDLLILIPFDTALANQTYNQFFNHLRTFLPFDTLVIGSDARFGKNQEGTPSAIAKLPWKTVCLPKTLNQQIVISSQAIRNFLQAGDLETAKNMLGRPYSIMLPFNAQNLLKTPTGVSAWSTHSIGICLLPSKLYYGYLSTESNPDKIPAIICYHGSTNNRTTTTSLTIYYNHTFSDHTLISIIFKSPVEKPINYNQCLNPATNTILNLSHLGCSNYE